MNVVRPAVWPFVRRRTNDEKIVYRFLPLAEQALQFYKRLLASTPEKH
jgi:hypothetical protein